MGNPKVVRFYLHRELSRRAATGQHNFINKLTSVLTQAGYEIKFHADSLDEQLKAKSRRGYSIVHMNEPMNDRGLTIRLNYFFPFWHIERCAKRWEWPVAKTAFDPKEVPMAEASRFAQYWRKRLFGNMANKTSRGGFVYVPLQGKLLSHRSFQYCSPIEMIEAILDYEKSRPIIVTLHPKEDYSAAELSALDKVARAHNCLTIETGGMEQLLKNCDYVATQNSSVALSGYFFHKPAVLFGQIDFHHIASNVHELPIAEAIETAPDMAPDYDAYLWWFLQHMSINAGRPEAEQKIHAALKRSGWQV